MNHNPIIKVPIAELKNNLVGFGKVIARHSTLPVLGMIHLARDLQGWVRLAATDLDTFLSLRLEAPAQMGEPAACLVPFTELQKLGKTCPADEVLEVEVLSEDKLILRHRIGSHPVEQVLTTLPAGDFPQVPEITAPSISLDEGARATLLDALACASEDVTRVILNGAYLDVSKPNGHYVVATDGRHLFSSNSLHLALPSSVLIPDHRFLSWGGFIKDGQWKLGLQASTKEKSGFIQVESRRWSFVTKQIEGNYPNWRTITEDVREFSGTIHVSEEAAQAMSHIVPRLPGDDTSNHTVGLYSVSGRLYLRGFNKDQQHPTEVEVPGVSITGEPATVYLNRQYLLKAIGMGLRQIGVQEPLKPLRFGDGGSRQMIVMPVRVEAFPSTKVSNSNKAPAAMPERPVTPIAASTDAQPDQPDTINDNPTVNSNETDHHQHERNHPPMQNENHSLNGNSHPSATAPNDNTQPPTPEKSPVEQALEQIEAIKSSVRAIVVSLNVTADTLRQVQRERRSNEREIRGVRDMLKTLQTVRS